MMILKKYFVVVAWSGQLVLHGLKLERDAKEKDFLEDG